MKDFRSQVESLYPEMVGQRRDFHRYPEIAFEEMRTASIVTQQLAELGLEVQTGVGQTGVVAVLEGKQHGPTVLVRCDMDALPIQEENQTEYVSQNANRMHACGHDGHMTIVLAVAKVLVREREHMHGQVKFLFQPAEEIAAGAKAIISDGALDDPKPDVSLGLHLWNELPLGTVALVPGPMMAGADLFQVKITGKGGHAAMPNLAVDPLLTAAHVITALQSIVSRNVAPQEVAVVSVTRLDTGDAFNVIPDSVTLYGTIRTFRKEVREHIVDRFQTILNGIVTAMGCHAEIDVQTLTTPVMNDPVIIEQLRTGFASVAPDLAYRDDVNSMASEDMALILERVPGVFFFVGSANAERGLNYPHHHPRFDFDEKALVIGASLLASAVSAYVL
jgi:amidohydrolase